MPPAQTTPALALRLHRAHQRAQKCWIDMGIVIQQRQVAPGRRLGALVDGRRKAGIGGISITFTDGKRDAISSSEPSCEPLSTMIGSTRLAG